MLLCFAAPFPYWLEEADPTEFSVTAGSVRRLARRNSQQGKVTLPAGCSEEQLEALLRPLEHLWHLSAVVAPAGTGPWLRLLRTH